MDEYSTWAFLMQIKLKIEEVKTKSKSEVSVSSVSDCNVKIQRAGVGDIA